MNFLPKSTRSAMKIREHEEEYYVSSMFIDIEEYLYTQPTVDKILIIFKLITTAILALLDFTNLYVM